jgi:hypothetical protein
LPFFSVLQDELNKGLFKDKKFCREVAMACVEHTGKPEIVEEFIDFLAAASEETRYNNSLGNLLTLKRPSPLTISNTKVHHEWSKSFLFKMGSESSIFT